MTDQPTRRSISRLLRFSVRILLLAITIAAIAFGMLGYQIQRAKTQEAAARKIAELGGKPIRTTFRNGVFYSGGKIPEPRFKWIHQFLGEEYFTYIPAIDVQNQSITADEIRKMIPYLHKIRLVEGINEAGKTNLALIDVGNPNVDEKLIDEFRSHAPQVIFTSTLVGKPTSNIAK